MLKLTKLVKQIEREEHSIETKQLRHKERENIELLGSVAKELKNIVENVVVFQNMTTSRLSEVAEALNRLSTPVLDIQKPIEIKKPSWWEGLDTFLISLQGFLERLTNKIIKTKLEEGTPETRQYVTVVDEQGRLIDWKKLIESLVALNRPIGMNRGFTTMRGGFTIVDDEVPTGDINGENRVFTLANTPTPSTSLHLYLNGARQRPGGVDFTLSGRTITFVNAPLSGSIILADYRYS